jgi:glucose/arabinose dehydrogenase
MNQTTRSQPVARVMAVLAAALCATLPAAEPTYPAGWQPRPAFPGQTRAPAPAQASPALQVTTLASGLTGAWSMAFLPNGHILVTQNQGTLRIVDPAKEWMSPFLKGVPVVKTIGANGLHDVVLDPDFARNRTLYITFFAPEEGEPGGSFPLHQLYEDVWSVPLAQRRTMKIGIEKIARARLSEDETELTDVRVIGTGTERRIVLARDGTIWGIGADRFWRYESKLDGMEHDFTADPDVRRNFSGRVIRINKDGTIPKDNPWLSRATVDAQTWAHGFKDPEGAAMNPATGELWTVEHGPQGGDEINIVRPGKDYGWPDVSYGTQYDARQSDGRKLVRVGNGRQSMPGVEEPAYYWFPSIAPSGMAFYTGDLVPQWKGNLFIGAMSAQYGQHLVRLVLDGNKVVAEEKLLVDPKRRFRDIRQGADGALYAIAGDSILRIAPKK